MYARAMQESDTPRHGFRPKTDILTIPNAMSLAGGALTCWGTKRANNPVGLAAVATGRLIDVADGAVARKLGQSSNFGALTDATIDKVATATYLWKLHEQGIVPPSVVRAFTGINMANSALTAVAMLQQPGEPQRPTRGGKWGLALQTAALLSFHAEHLLKERHPGTARIAGGLGRVATLCAIPLSLSATRAYYRRLR